MVVHADNASIWETEAGRWKVQAQSGQFSKTLFENKK